MVSEPNFILGIKQNISRKQKKNITCTPPLEVTHVYLLDLDSMASYSHRGSVLCPRIHKLKQTRDINIRSMHIKPSPDETNKIDVLHDISRQKPRNPTSNGSRTRHHTWTMAIGTLTCAAEDSRLPDQISATRVAKTTLSFPDPLDLRIW